MKTLNLLNSLDFTSIAKRHKLNINQIKYIYKLYYIIIRDKMSEFVNNADCNATKEEINYSETAFNLRYLGVYYLSHKLLKRKKNENK